MLKNLTVTRLLAAITVLIAALTPQMTQAQETSSSGTKTIVQTDTNAGCAGQEFQLRELQVETLQVTNQDVKQLLQILKVLGYTTVAIPGTEQPQAAATTSRYGAPSYGQPPGQSFGQPSPQRFGQPPMQTYGQVPRQVAGRQATTQTKTEAARKYTCQELPVIVMPPPVSDTRLGFSSGDYLGLAGGGAPSGGLSTQSYGGGRSGSSSNVRGDISPALHTIAKPHSGEVDQLFVFYHPGQERQVRELETLVRKNLDVAASQIYIEGLILEVSEGKLRELGVRYNRVDPDNNRIVSVGAVGASSPVAGGAPVFDLVRDTLLNASVNPERILLEIQALVSDGTAEVLSRPSILTLNNRQATIQIIDIVQFPIQEATLTGRGDILQSAFSFEAVRPGITLNLRPRISADRKFVSMEIDVTVEALVSANNGEVLNDQGKVIATKPGSSARRVQTFARIPDRTPIIIGGLISSDKETVKNRVPFFGSIPIIGKLFGATRKSVGKREVIIVLTPYIVGEQNSQADVSIPKDTSLFDITDKTLFQDSYRIRSEDVYDLRFLSDSPEFTGYQRYAEKIKDQDPGRAGEAPFNRFLGGHIPGGDKFLNRMMFDLVRRRNFGQDITYERLIVLGETMAGNTEVALMSNLFAEVQASRKPVIMVFGEDDEGETANQTADIQITQLPRGKSWDDHLWDLSYGVSGGKRSAIIVRNEADLAALVDSLISAAILDGNGGYDKLSVGSFKKGALLSIPSFDTDRFYVIDDKVARVFVDVQHYYRAAMNELEYTYSEMKEAQSRDLSEIGPE